jgi:hypothetical protein
MKVVITNQECGYAFILESNVIRDYFLQKLEVVAEDEFSIEYKFSGVKFWYNKKHDEYGHSIYNTDSKLFRSNSALVDAVEKFGGGAFRTDIEPKIIEIPFDTLEGWDVKNDSGHELVRETLREWR